MNQPILNMQDSVVEGLYPTVMMWNRTEGRPRATKNFDRALKAEVRDALWMLTRQWQMGEFEGDDAGSPALAKIRMDTTQLTKYQASNHPIQAFTKEIPLEALVEQKVLPFTILQGPISLDLQLMLGRKWKFLLEKHGLTAQLWKFSLKNFPIPLPDPDDAVDAFVCAHPEAWQQVAAVAGRMVNGASIYQYLKAQNKLKDLPDGGLIPTEPVALIADFLAWFDQLFLQPDDAKENAWRPEHLEYQFNCSAPTETGEKVYVAREYYHGHLDWYNLDVSLSLRSLAHPVGSEPDPVLGRTVKTLLPTPVTFDGMPNTRWWAFEDGRTNYNYIKPGTHELSKLMFLEFGLVYANDWFLVPFELPVGTIALVKGLTIQNVFGEHFWLEPAGRGGDGDWDRWNMYTISIEGSKNMPSDQSLLILPSVPKIQESKPHEQVVFIRDEMANMVWAIETTVPLPSGESISGHAAAAQVRSYLQMLVDKKNTGVPPSDQAMVSAEEKPKIRYEIMNQVPENWIPFISTHVPNDVRETQLQRAAMSRFLNGDKDKPVKIRPRTALLQEGLADKLPYFIFEEEISRAGTQVFQSFQRTRWKDGRIFVWFGSRKTAGRGEGSSGLAFDRILENK